MVQFLFALAYSLLGAFGVALAQTLTTGDIQPGQPTWGDFWHFVHMLGGAVFGASCHAVAVRLAKYPVAREKRMPRILGGAVAAFIGVAAARAYDPAVSIPFEVVVAGLSGWAGSQIVEAASGEAMEGARRLVRRWFDRVAPPPKGGEDG